MSQGSVSKTKVAKSVFFRVSEAERKSIEAAAEAAETRIGLYCKAVVLNHARKQFAGKLDSLTVNKEEGETDRPSPDDFTDL